MFKTSDDNFKNENLVKNMLIHNIHRGRILAFMMVIFYTIFALLDITAFKLRINNEYHFNFFFMMYIIMIVLNIIYLIFLNFNKNIKEKNYKDLKVIEFIIVAYITVIMTWGSVVSLMNQKMYGQIIVFMVIMISCSVFYLTDIKKILIPYFISVMIIIVGLPFFQRSNDVRIGHYLNLIIFIFISYATSRLLYFSFYNNFMSKELLKKSNLLLKKEIEQNALVNMKLAEANLQMKELSLIDELTGMPNRRSFNEHIYKLLESNFNEPKTISIIMIDIDYFKQFNDCYGHNEGDKVLQKVAKVISNLTINNSGFTARWGGEEFIYVNISINDEAIEFIAESIRNNVQALEIVHRFSKNRFISVSAGYSSMNVSNFTDVRKCIDFADKAMYYAKASGRNCIKKCTDILHKNILD